jgi:thiamine pyrophosphokinase
MVYEPAVKCVIVAGGEVLPADRGALEGAELVVAADSGLLALGRWNVRPDLLVGDLDSLTEADVAAARSEGVRVLSYPPAKDETDLELALREAVGAGADQIVVLGALGGARVDHELAAVQGLASEALTGRDVSVVRGGLTVRVLRGGGVAELRGNVGDLVTLLPLRGDAAGVRTEGLGYPLEGATLRFAAGRGVSNVVERVPGRVTLERGMLLVVEVPAALDRADR